MQVIAHKTGYYKRVHMYVYVMTAYMCGIKYRQHLTLAFKIHAWGHVNEDLKCSFLRNIRMRSLHVAVTVFREMSCSPLPFVIASFGKLKGTRSGWPWSAYRWCQILSDSVKLFPVSKMPTDSVCYSLSRVSRSAIERSERERERGRKHCSPFLAEMKTVNEKSHAL